LKGNINPARNVKSVIRPSHSNLPASRKGDFWAESTLLGLTYYANRCLTKIRWLLLDVPMHLSGLVRIFIFHSVHHLVFSS